MQWNVLKTSTLRVRVCNESVDLWYCMALLISQTIKKWTVVWVGWRWLEKIWKKAIIYLRHYPSGGQKWMRKTTNLSAAIARYPAKMQITSASNLSQKHYSKKSTCSRRRCTNSQSITKGRVIWIYWNIHEKLCMDGYTVGTFRSFSTYSLICGWYLSQWRSIQFDYLHEIPAFIVLLSWMYFWVPHRYFQIWVTTHDMLVSTEWYWTLFTKYASHSTASIHRNVQQETLCHIEDVIKTSFKWFTSVSRALSKRKYLLASWKWPRIVAKTCQSNN